MKKILIIKHGALGDMVFSLPAFEAIRSFYKDAQITILTSEPYKEFASLCPFFDHVLIDNRKPPLKHPKYNWDILQTIKKGAFELIIDLQRSSRTKQYKTISKLWHPAPLWCSTHPGSDYHLDIPNLYVDHILRINARQIKTLGINKTYPAQLDWMEQQTKGISLKKPYFLMVPGTSIGQEHKKWPASHYGMIGRLLAKKGITPLILGTALENDTFKIIKDACPEAESLIGKTSIFDIPALARDAVGALGNDSGPMHFCYFSGCPSLYLFSHSSAPELCGPLEPHGAVLKEKNIGDISVELVSKCLKLRTDI